MLVMGTRHKLKMLFESLRNPTSPAPVNLELDARIDRVDAELKRRQRVKRENQQYNDRLSDRRTRK